MLIQYFVSDYIYTYKRKHHNQNLEATTWLHSHLKTCSRVNQGSLVEKYTAQRPPFLFIKTRILQLKKNTWRKEYSVLYFETVKSEDLQASLLPITKFLCNACKTACKTVFTENISHFLGFFRRDYEAWFTEAPGTQKCNFIKETFTLNTWSATECTSLQKPQFRNTKSGIWSQLVFLVLGFVFFLFSNSSVPHLWNAINITESPHKKSLA